MVVSCAIFGRDLNRGCGLAIFGKLPAERIVLIVDLSLLDRNGKLETAFRSLDGEEWPIRLDQTKAASNNGMSRDCAKKLPLLLVLGRNIKFSMVEGYPGSGLALKNVWFLTYVKSN